MHAPPVTLRAPREIEQIARAARTAADAIREAMSACREGGTTGEVAARAAHSFESAGAAGLFRGYRQGNSPPFPADVCVSVNEEVVHGVPGRRVLCAGDAVSIDVGIKVDGWCADMAASVVVPGSASGCPERVRRIEFMIGTARAMIRLAAARAAPGVRWSVIARELEHSAYGAGFGIVTEYVGHGIGRDLHEPPKVPCYETGFDGDDFVLREGMVLAVEPILTFARTPMAGRHAVDSQGLPAWRTPVRLLADGWTVATADDSPAVHEERLLAITAGGCRVLADV